MQCEKQMYKRPTPPKMTTDALSSFAEISRFNQRSISTLAYFGANLFLFLSLFSNTSNLTQTTRGKVYSTVIKNSVCSVMRSVQAAN